jgi:ribosomal protein S18 acetylase RimI-like enzyme
MIAHRLLSNADLNSLYDCFLIAFSDYAVDMRMSLEQFQQRLTRDGICLDISAGAFDGDRMIGFCLNALGEWRGKSTAYDGGSAIVPAYRGRGIATEMFAFLQPKLKEIRVVQYLLEVLTSNVPAATLYRKLGFVETRRLAVFRSGPQKGTKGTKKPPVTIRYVEQPDWQLFQTFWDGYPAWQNSIAAVERATGDRNIVGAYVDDECVGYGIVFTPTMNLMQLVVSPRHRRHGIGSAILASLEPGAEAGVEGDRRLKINNIDKDQNATLAFYEANSYKQVLEQYEMMKTLQ